MAKKKVNTGLSEVPLEMLEAELNNRRAELAARRKQEEEEYEALIVKLVQAIKDNNLLAGYHRFIGEDGTGAEKHTFTEEKYGLKIEVSAYFDCGEASLDIDDIKCNDPFIKYLMDTIGNDIYEIEEGLPSFKKFTNGITKKLDREYQEFNAKVTNLALELGFTFDNAYEDGCSTLADISADLFDED